jgi:hypothetical protein
MLADLVHAVFGHVQDSPPASPEWENIERRDGDGYSCVRIRYRLTPAEWGYAWLLRPCTQTVSGPAVIALHQTVMQGKDEPAGIAGDASLAYARDLAERGFVVLAPDAIGFGDRQSFRLTTLYHDAADFSRAHPDGSVAAKMAFDVQRAVDLLSALPQVDPRRIGCIGHSHGGYGTLFGMLADERITTGVISCGLATLRGDPHPDRWWLQTALLPRLGLYGDIVSTPFDLQHLLALLAPRRVFVSVALQDACFPYTADLPTVGGLVSEVYGLYGAGDRFEMVTFGGPHSFPLYLHEKAYGAFTLGRSGDNDSTEKT